MANSKKLRKAAIKFRKAEPVLHETISNALTYMAHFINKTGASEVTAVVQIGGGILDIYANE